MLTVGCIGCGNMGGAMLRGLGKTGRYRLLGVEHHPEKLAACGAEPADPGLIGREADIILVAVKPYAAAKALEEALDGAPNRRRLVLSVVAGIGMKRLKAIAAGRAAVVRCMPNTPAAVGMGSFGVCLEDPALDEEQKREVRELLGALGRVEELPESQFAPFTALMGCGPAYIFYVIEALAEAGVRMGFSRARAVEMASWLCAGSAKLALQPGAHPSILREQVCSPAGSTIEGVAALDELAVKSAIEAAVFAAWEKEKSREC